MPTKSAVALDDEKEFVISKPIPRNASDPNLRHGEQYRESLRDGRHVIVNGRDVEDVTSEPTLGRAIDTIAWLYDAQFDPDHRDVLTTIDPDTGERISTAWLIPRTQADLWRYDELIKLSTFHTFGVFGRPPDYGPAKAISFVAWNHLIRDKEPEALDKILNFLRVGQQANLLSADTLIDVQSNRKLPMPEQAGRLRVIEERKDGIVLSGAKAGNSILPQGNIATISMPPPNPTMPEECNIWAVIPANAPGIKMVLRGSFTTGTEHQEDHPLDARGEESDCLVIFDKVFIPWENVFSYKNEVTSKIYTTLGRFAFWKVATRLSYRAEIFAGAAQMIVEALGTGHIQGVRALVADVMSYALSLRGILTAAIEKAEVTESGVILPNHALVTAGRIHAIVNYPKIMQNLRDLCGQGLVSRIPRATWERTDIGPMLNEYLPGYRVTSRQKNRLFNLIWDMSCSSNAMRIALFENLNSLPPPALREELYGIYEHGGGLDAVRRLAAID